MARTHKTTLQRRNQIAYDQGYRGKRGGLKGAYTEKRKALSYAKNSEEFQAYAPDDEVNGRNNQTAELAKLYYRAHHTTPDTYKVTGNKAKWYVGVEQVMSYTAWAENYPLGIRESKWARAKRQAA